VISEFPINSATLADESAKLLYHCGPARTPVRLGHADIQFDGAATQVEAKRERGKPRIDQTK
jgi:phosphoribosyl-ATP pyrophosphohydrolase